MRPITAHNHMSCDLKKLHDAKLDSFSRIN